MSLIKGVTNRSDAAGCSSGLVLHGPPLSAAPNWMLSWDDGRVEASSCNNGR
jgi:hypothetical protein